MKSITPILIASLLLTILTAGFAAAATIKVRSDSWPPYNDEPNSAQPGYMIEIAELIFAPYGHKVDYKLMPWTRSLDGVRQGSYDAVVGTDPEESPDFVFPKESFGINQNGFFVKKGSSWKYDGIASVEQIRLGVIDSYGYYSALDEYIAKNKKSRKVFAVTGDDALPKLLKMLQSGRVDAVVENIDVMGSILRNSQFEGQIVNVGLAEDNYAMYMAFSPGKESSKDYSKIFDEGIAKLRRSGKLQEVLSRYGLKDWK